MTFNLQQDLLIIPDVHGRKFWKNALDEKNHSHVIFLGDYVDPYSYEGIDDRDAFTQLGEIIKYARDHRDTTTLLLGNHDMHYKDERFKQLAEGTRFSYSMWADLEEVFNANDDLFQLAFEADYEGTHCLFTHAGVSSVWYENNKDVIGELNADNLNQLALTNEGIQAIAEIGYARGGWTDSGGMLWADLMEVCQAKPIEGIYQIFGHTQNRFNKPFIYEHVACLDCHQAFLLSEVIQMAKERDKE